MVSAASPGTLLPSSSAVSFGAVSVGQTASAAVSLVNNGSNPVQISQISLDGASFSVNQQGAPVTVAAGSSYNVQVQFRPAAAGAASGKLTVVSDATNGSTSQIALSGSGQVAQTGNNGSQSPLLSVSTSNLSFGEVAPEAVESRSLTLTSSGTAPLTINAAAVTGAGFSLSGANFPLTLNAGHAATLSVHFAPTTTGTVNGTLTLSSNSAAVAKTTIPLTATAQPDAALRSVYCSTPSVTGALTEHCSAILSAAAPAAGVTIALHSSAAALQVPASITVPAGATSATFNASVAAVLAAQKITLTANAGTVTTSWALQLNAATPKMSVSHSTVSFGQVQILTESTKTVRISSVGSYPLTINAAQVTGKGFVLSGASFPLTLDAGQSVLLSIGFEPTSTAAVDGSLILSSNSSTGAKTTIELTASVKADGALSGISCSQSTVTGAAAESCTVTLNGPAASGGLKVSLASSDNAVSVPGSVTVAAGATSASFAANVTAVTAARKVTLTASSNTIAKTDTLQLNAAAATLSVSSSSVAFGNSALNTSVSQSLTVTSSGTSPLTISAATLTGTGFTVSGATFPLTLAPGKSAVLTVRFDPTAAGTYSGSLKFSSNSSTGSNIAVSLSGTGNSTVTLEGLSCSSASPAPGTDACTVTLTGPAASGGATITLSSSSSVVTVPASVAIAAKATSATFNATVSTVTAAQTVTLKAADGTVAKTLALQLQPGTRALQLNANSISFGTVTLKNSSTQSLTLKSTGTASLTISAASLTGAGFSMSGMGFPVTLNPGQTATLDVEFDPASSGSAAGKLTLTSNASTAGTAVVSLSGTGQASAYQVDLNWEAPSTGAKPIEGYKVYRATGGSSSYQLLTSSLDSTTSYDDSSVASGESYSYEVTSVDATGTESQPSSPYSVQIP